MIGGIQKIPSKIYPQNAPERPPNQERETYRHRKKAKLFDGGGLYLEVTPAGGKIFRLKYRIDGKEKR